MSEQIDNPVEVKPVKIYASKSKEVVNAYNKKYYAEHRADRLKCNTIHCTACDKDIRKDNYKRHCMSKLHFLSSRVNAIIE